MAQPRIDQTGFRRTLTRAIILPLIAMALLIGVLLWQLSTMLSAARAVDHTDQVISQAHHVQKLLLDLETGVRGYLITGVPTFLDPYTQAQPQIHPAFARLSESISDNPEQQALVNQLLPLYDQWAQYAQQVIQLRDSGGDYSNLAQMSSGKQLMDSIRGQFDTFVANEEDLRNMRTRAAQQATLTILLSCIGLGCLIGVALAFFSRRQLLVLSQSYGQLIAVAQERADELAEQRERLHVTLTSIGDAVIVTDTSGAVTFANPVAQALTGWSEPEAHGQAIEKVFDIVNEETRKQVENPVAKVLREGMVVGLANHTILLTKSGGEVPIDDSAAPIRAAGGKIVGVVLVFRDIAERKRVELAQARLAAQVDEQRQRLNTIIASVPGVVWEAWGEPDADSQRINFVSGFVELMLGYSVEEWVSTPNFWLTIVHPDDREQAVRQAATTFTSGQLGINQFRWIRRDGQAIWVETHSTAIIDEHGRAIGMRGVTMDISERKRTEANLLASEQRYRELANALPLVVWTARPSGALDFISQRWHDYTGAADMQAPASWETVLHPDDLRPFLARWEESLRSGQPYSLEYRWRYADNTYRWHLGRALPVRDHDGAVAYWVGTSTEIDEQKRAEDGQRLLAEASVLLVSMLDFEATLSQLARLVVPQLADWCAIHLLEESGLIRRLAIAHIDPAKEAQAQGRPERYPLDPSGQHIVAHVLRSGEPEVYRHVDDTLLVDAARDAEHLRTLRTLGFTSYMCIPLITRGHVLGTITFVTADSGRHYGKAEQALAEDLASRAAIMVDNARLYQDAQRAVRARDQFLSIASHELKTPLTSLIGYIELIQRRMSRDSRLEERDRRALRIVGEQAGRLNKLVGALLDLSRIENGQLSIERGLVDLRTLMQRLAEEVQQTTDRHTFSVVGDGQPLPVRGDELRLEQVMQNIIQNAIKYSPQGGTITVHMERRAGTACVAVSDQGIGIPAAALSQLFQRFYRAPNADSQHISGMGIGLYVVKEIIELHGGSINVSSQEGQGSTFTVCLPILLDDSMPEANLADGVAQTQPQ